MTLIQIKTEINKIIKEVNNNINELQDRATFFKDYKPTIKKEFPFIKISTITHAESNCKQIAELNLSIQKQMATLRYLNDLQNKFRDPNNKQGLTRKPILVAENKCFRITKKGGK